MEALTEHKLGEIVPHGSLNLIVVEGMDCEECYLHGEVPHKQRLCRTVRCTIRNHSTCVVYKIHKEKG